MAAAATSVGASAGALTTDGMPIGAGPVVLLGASEPSKVVTVLTDKQAVIASLYGSSTTQQAARVKAYIKEKPAIDVFPRALATVGKYACGGAIGGACIGAAAGVGNPAVMAGGAAAGAVVGAGFGLHAAYKEQQYQYADWLADKTNAQVNKEVLDILKGIIRERVNMGDENYADLIDPINETFMQRPVIDPTNGKVFDYNQHHKWIAQNKRSFWSYEKLELKDLKICYLSHGRLALFYKMALYGELAGVQLNEGQKKCVKLLLTDLERDRTYYYNQAREEATKALNAGKLHPIDYGERIKYIGMMLYPR